MVREQYYTHLLITFLEPWGSNAPIGGISMGSLPTPRMMNCHECGRLIDEESQFCQYCGHELPSEELKTEQEREAAAEQRSELPMIGGSLIILSSIFIFVTIWLVLDQRGNSEQEWIGSLIADWRNWFLGLLAVFGVVGIIGGISAVARKSQGLAILGGLLSSFGIGMVIGVIGLALVAVSEDEFQSAISDYTDLPEEIDSRALEKPGFGWRR
jgi:hypothetical protein